MAKKQKSFADKTEASKDKDAIYVKYVKSVKSEKTGQWRFNEKMIRSTKGEHLDVALKRLDEVANLVDIDLSQFKTQEVPAEERAVEVVETSGDESVTEEKSTEEANKTAVDDSSEKLVEETPAEK